MILQRWSNTLRYRVPRGELYRVILSSVVFVSHNILSYTEISYVFTCECKTVETVHNYIMYRTAITNLMHLGVPIITSVSKIY